MWYPCDKCEHAATRIDNLTNTKKQSVRESDTLVINVNIVWLKWVNWNNTRNLGKRELYTLVINVHYKSQLKGTQES